jgi:KRAB domain-containing zinc finger protein
LKPLIDFDLNPNNEEQNEEHESEQPADEDKPVVHKCKQCELTFTSVLKLGNHLTSVHKVPDSRFQCPVCELVCPNRSKLRTHIEEVHDKKKVSCPQCQKMFSKGGLRNHIKYFHDVDRVTKPFKCSECDFSSHALKYLKAHHLNCHDKSRQKYKCEKCGDRFPFPSHLKLHQCGIQAVKNRGGPVTCPECDQELKARQYLVNHFKKVHGRLPPGYENQQKFMCDQCTNVFFNEWSLKLHIKSKHTDPQVKPSKTICPECDQEFNATMYYVQHYKYVHGGLPPGFEDKEKFMCDQCPSVFFNNLSLKLHYKTKHNAGGVKEIAKVGRRNCPHCEKTFATYLSYKEHIKSKHEKDTPYKCDQCHRSYGTSGRLRVHKKNMHQRIKCDQCGQEICNIFILKRHKASVHGITPTDAHQCEFCPSFFEHLKAKDKHVMKHHMEKSEPALQQPQQHQQQQHQQQQTSLVQHHQHQLQHQPTHQM